jgi:hypothetical protein
MTFSPIAERAVIGGHAWIDAVDIGAGNRPQVQQVNMGKSIAA